MKNWVADNQELLRTLITVIGGIITTSIGAYVSIRLGQKKYPRRPGKR